MKHQTTIGTKMTQNPLLAACAAVALFGCASDDAVTPPTDVERHALGEEAAEFPDGDAVEPDSAVISGRTELAAGSQSIGRFGVLNWPVHGDRAQLVGADGAAILETGVDAEGRFRFEGLDEVIAPFEVQIVSDGEVRGRLISGRTLQPGEQRLLAPVSAETTVEAEVLEAVRARATMIDQTLLTARISAEMARHCPVDAMADALIEADLAMRLVIAERDLFAGTQLLGLRGGTMQDLHADLFGAEVQSERDAAFRAWHRQTNQALITAGVQGDVLIHAQLAAGVAQNARLEGTCREASLAVASDLVRAATAVSLERSLAELPASLAHLEAAVDTHYREIDAADSHAALIESRADFDAALVGLTLAEMNTGEVAEEVALASAVALNARADELGAQMRARVNAAADGDDLAVVVADAVEEMVDTLSAERVQMGTRQRAYLDLVLMIDEGHPVVTPDRPLVPMPVDPDPNPEGEPEPEPETVIDLDLPVYDDDPCRGPGAIGVPNRGDGLIVAADLEAATDVVLFAALNGEAPVQIGAGAIADGQASVGIVDTPPEDALLVVALFEGDTLVGGRVHFDALQADGRNDVGPITVESSVEARIVLGLLARGEAVDLCLIDDLIDGAVSAAITEQAELDAVIDGILAAQAAQSAALDVDVLGRHPACMARQTRRPTYCEAPADETLCGDLTVHADAAATFDGVVGAQIADNAALDAVALARSRLAATVSVACDLDLDLSASVDAFATALVNADDADDVVMAAAMFRADVMAAIDVQVEAGLVNPLLEVGVRAAIEAALIESHAAEIRARDGLAGNAAAAFQALARLDADLDLALAGLELLGLDADAAANVRALIRAASHALVAADF